LRPLGATWLAKSNQDRLDYETLLELVSEKFFSHPQLVRQMNPGLDWRSVKPGSIVYVPQVGSINVSGTASFIRISLAARHLEVFNESTNLLTHFPCSIAQAVEKRPVGKLEVEDLVPNPVYVFDPANFPTSPEAPLGKMVLKAGRPNNPVGTVWIKLNRPGYGIHGTPRPEEVGRTGSLGCFRLANWNAETLLKMAWRGMPVYVDP
jgi:lipoprotein-anchoring transpeptidase ErfK/SrfK